MWPNSPPAWCESQGNWKTQPLEGLTCYGSFQDSRRRGMIGIPPPEPGMTPEHEPLIRELIRLIVDERDPGKLRILASDLERLLIISGRPLPAVHQKPRSS